MSLENIVAAVGKIDIMKTWKTVLISFDHRKAPNEFTSYSFSFHNPMERNEIIKQMCESFLNEAKASCQDVQEYTGMNAKGTVDRIAVTNNLISTSWDSLTRSISIADDNTPINNVKARAFVFMGTYDGDENEENVFFLKLKNPVTNLKRITGMKAVFTLRRNNVYAVDEPLLQFGKNIDAIVYKKVLYALNSNIETILNMEYSRNKICKARLDEIEQAGIVNEINAYRDFATSAKYPYMFLTYDAAMLKRVSSIEGKELLQNGMSIPVLPETGKFDLSNHDKAKLFTQIICGKAKKDLFDPAFCEVTSSKPIIVQQ